MNLSKPKFYYEVNKDFTFLTSVKIMMKVNNLVIVIVDKGKGRGQR